MKESINAVERRTVLQSLLASCAVGLAGCADSNDGSEPSPFVNVTISGTSIDVTLEDDHSVDQLTLIQPNGESFANQSVTPGSTQEAIEIGTHYEPGEYTIHAIAEGDSIGERSITISPDVKITDLKLGQNHPDEMYEGAGNSTTRSEVILSVANNGSGPDSATQLVFEGDVPQPTDKSADQSWIYDTKAKVGGEAENVLIPAAESITLYSTSRPFTSASDNVSCTSEGEEGQFTVDLQLRIGEAVQRIFDVKYAGGESGDCTISVSEGDE